MKVSTLLYQCLVGAACWALIIAAGFLLFGCGGTPYLKYSHLDQTPLESESDDAYNFFCPGYEVGERLVAEIDACQNVSSAKGRYLNISLKWRLK